MLADLIVNVSERRSTAFYHGRYRHSPVDCRAYEAEDFSRPSGKVGRWLFITAAPLRNAGGGSDRRHETFWMLRASAEPKRRCATARESAYRSLSETDSLTGLVNPRHLHEQRCRD